MKDILEVFRKRMDQKNLGSLSIGAFLTHQIKLKSKDPELCSGYIKGTIFYITLSPSDDKTMRFITKHELKSELNRVLEDAGYNYQLKEIKFW